MSRSRPTRPYGADDVKRAIRFHAPRLLALPHVLYLGVGEQLVGDAGTGRLALKVFVSHKRDMVGAGRIPRRVRGVTRRGAPAAYFVPIDVEAVGDGLRSLALGADSIRGRMRGRIGVAYQTAAGRRYVLTNSHVTSGVGRRGIGDTVALRDGTALGTVRRASLLRSGRANTVDAALVSPVIPTDLLAFRGVEGPLVRVQRLVQDDSSRFLFFYGTQARRKTFLRPQPIATPVPVDVDGQTVHFTDVVQLRAAGVPAVPGDSGSLLLKRRGRDYAAVGLVFGGNRQVLLVCRLTHVFKQLGRKAAAGPGGQAEDVQIDFG